MATDPYLEIDDFETGGNPEVPLNDRGDDIIGKMVGYIAVALSDANYNLYTNQDADGDAIGLRNATFEFTGTLTFQRVITLPPYQGKYTVWNNTTGGYSLIFEASGAASPTISVTVPAGKWADLVVEATTLDVRQSNGALLLNPVDIDGGTIDGVTIGGAAAGAGTFTTLTATGAFTSLGIDDNATAERLQLSNTIIHMSPTTGVLVGDLTTTPDGTLHVHTATAGAVTAHENANEAVFESGGVTGITLLSPDANQSEITFGSPSSNNYLRIIGQYANGASVMNVVNSTTTRYAFQMGPATLAAAATGRGLRIDLADTTITGAATAWYTAAIEQVDITAATSQTISTAASFYIANQPAGVGAGPATITNSYALFVDAGKARFDGDGTHVFELPADATDPTGGGGAATGRIAVKIGGATRYLAYY